MHRIVIKLSRQRKRFLTRLSKKAQDARFVRKVLIVLALAENREVTAVAEVFRLHRSTVWRVARRFLANEVRGLRDGRSERGPSKVTPEVPEKLEELVRGSPREFGYARPTWTRALLAREIAKQTGVSLSLTTIGRLLARIGSRWNRPRPVVGCPWPEEKRKRKVREIKRMLARLPPDEVALFEDEAEIHLNPKIGFDWMMRGEQKEILTPGRNEKGYLAGAVESDGRRVVWVRGERKNSDLFISFLKQLDRTYREAKRIHLILDNYCIHKSKATQKALEELEGRIELHFLPPYCPEENKMEIQWLHLHRNVTCNHDCSEIETLMGRAADYLDGLGQRTSAASRTAA